MKDNRYLAYGPAYSGKMGKQVQPGDTVRSLRGEAVIESWDRPKSLDHAGRVYVKPVGDEPPQQYTGGFHPAVYGLEWAGSIELDGEPGLSTGRVSSSEPDIQNLPGTLAAALEMAFAKRGPPRS